MSVFKLSKNDEEIKLHMEAYIDHANSLEGFYSDYNFHYYDSSWEEGWIEFIHTATAYDMNRYGNMHGGIIMMLADTASGITSFEAGTGNSSPTMDMNISFLKPIHKGDDMILRAQILYAGKHNCVVRTDVKVNGELAAVATTMQRMYTSTTPDKPILLKD